jgi:hypothetical protein
MKNMVPFVAVTLLVWAGYAFVTSERSPQFQERGDIETSRTEFGQIKTVEDLKVLQQALVPNSVAPPQNEDPQEKALLTEEERIHLASIRAIQDELLMVENEPFPEPEPEAEIAAPE